MAPSKKKAPLTKALIHEVQDHPSLWDKRSKDYKNIIVSANAWKEILFNLEATFSPEQLSDNNLSCIEEIKKHWQNLRNVYVKKKARATSGADDVPDKKEWNFFSMLQFLDLAGTYEEGVEVHSSHVSQVEEDQNSYEDIDSETDEDCESQDEGQEKIVTQSSTDNFRLRWNDFEPNFVSSINQLREDSDFLDVTLVTSDCGSRVLQAHKVVLSACSNFFKQILRQQSRGHPHPNPFIFLRGIGYNDLVSILDFMYHGEVKIAQNNLNNFLTLAEELQIKGLANRKQTQAVARTVAKTSRPSSDNSGSPAKKIRKSLPKGSTLTSGKFESGNQLTTELNIKSEPKGFQLTSDKQVVESADDSYDAYNDDLSQMKVPFDAKEFVRFLPDLDPPGAECTVCGDKFKGFGIAKAHVNRLHGPPMYIQCNFCEKIIKTPYSFRDHVIQKHGINGRKLVETYGKVIEM